MRELERQIGKDMVLPKEWLTPRISHPLSICWRPEMSKTDRYIDHHPNCHCDSCEGRKMTHAEIMGLLELDERQQIAWLCEHRIMDGYQTRAGSSVNRHRLEWHSYKSLADLAYRLRDKAVGKDYWVWKAACQQVREGLTLSGELLNALSLSQWWSAYAGVIPNIVAALLVLEATE